MRIKKRSFFELFFPLMLIAFIGQGTRFVDFLVSSNLRWLLLLLLFGYLLSKKKLLRGVNNYLLLIFTAVFGVVYPDCDMVTSILAIFYEKRHVFCGSYCFGVCWC